MYLLNGINEIEYLKSRIKEIKNNDNCSECSGTGFGSYSNNTIHYSCEGSLCKDTEEILIESVREEIKEMIDRLKDDYSNNTISTAFIVMKYL